MTAFIARCIKVSETDNPGEGLRFHAKFAIYIGAFPPNPRRGTLKLGPMKVPHYFLGQDYSLDIHPVDPQPKAQEPGPVQQGHPDGFIDPEKSL